MSESDPTEAVRRIEQAVINAEHADREALEQEHGQVWSSAEMQRDYAVQGFMAPYVIVRRRSDDTIGSLKFQHEPRFYFGWLAD